MVLVDGTIGSEGKIVGLVQGFFKLHSRLPRPGVDPFTCMYLLPGYGLGRWDDRQCKILMHLFIYDVMVSILKH